MKKAALISIVIIVLLMAAGYAAYRALPGFLTAAAGRYTGADITYRRWTGNPVGRSTLEDLTLILKGRGITVNAGTVDLTVDLGANRFFSDRAVNMVCEMEDVVFDVPGAYPSRDRGNILAVSFSPGVHYDDIKFRLRYTREAVFLYDLAADSDSVRMTGSCRYFKKGDYMELLLNISVSPEVYGSLPEQVRSTALELKEDGWYGTVIDIKAPWKIFQFMAALPMMT